MIHRFLAGLAVGVVLATIDSSACAETPVDPRRPAAIETTSVPVIPDELAQRLAQFQNTRHASFLGWAPTGEGVLIGTRFGNTTQLHWVRAPGGRREQITFFPEPVTGRFLPGSTTDELLLSLSAGGSENDQVLTLDRRSGRSTLLTDGKSRNLLGPAREDGGQIVIGSNRRNGRDTDLYLADPRRADSMRVFFEVTNEHWSASDWSRDGTKLLLNRYVSANESYPALYDLEKRKRVDLPFPPGGAAPASFGDGAFTPDGRQAYLTTDARGEFRELARVDLESGRYEWLSADIPWNVESLDVAPDGTVAFATNEDGASRLFLLRGETRTAVELPLGVIGGLKFDKASARLGFTLARPDAPADVYSIEVANPTAAAATLARWTYSEVGGLNPQTFIAPERIRYPSFDGRAIPAFYSHPRAAQRPAPAPVLIVIHGGPEGQYLATFSGFQQFCLTELGIAILAPNVRGSDGYGKTYLRLDNAEKREDSVRDIGALLDWIATRPELDENRVAVMGGSYGGYMVLASLVHFPDRIRAGIDIVGIANFVTFLERTSSYRQDLRRAEYGDERDPAMRAVFERISPATNADRIRSALLVAHGKNDPRVPFSEAEQIAAKVAASGKSVWTLYASNEGHGFGKKDNRDYLDAVIALFLERQVLGR